MFLAEGFSVHFVDGASHLVAQHLLFARKADRSENVLLRLIGAFLDFSVAFTASAVLGILGDLRSTSGISEGHRFSDEKEWSCKFRIASANPERPSIPIGLRDLARGCPTDQSTISEWSRRRTTREDSAGAVAGLLTGSYSFHTSLEDRPWWSVDLRVPAEIREIRIFGRLETMDIADRCKCFAIEVATEQDQWKEIWRKTDQSRFGGADGKPYIWQPNERLVTQYLRIRLLGRNFLHYDAIEILGRSVMVSAEDAQLK
jgi:hypothetical protein